MENNKDIEAEVVSTLLDEPVKFTVKVDRQNILHRLGILPKQRVFVIKKAKLRTLYKVSQQLVNLKGIEIRENGFYSHAAQNVVDNMPTQLNIVALAINNDGKDPDEELKNFIDINLDTDELKELIDMTFGKLGITSFLSTIISVKGVSLTSPEEIIAPGDSSEE